MFGMLDELREERKQLDAQEAAWLRNVAAYDRSHDWRAEGYFSAANALRHACRMDAGVASGHVVLARKVEDLPELADAFASGEISRSHAHVIAQAYTPERAAELSDAVSVFVRTARSTEPHELRNVVRYVTDMIDGDGGAAEDDAKYARRQWYQSRTLDAMLKIDALLDPEYAEYWEKAVSAEMERDYLAGDTRSPAQRRADAATNLIRQSLDHGRIGTSRAVRPHVTIVQDVRDLPGTTPELLAEAHNERHRHGRLSAATIERLMCDCDVTRVITNGKSEILDVGRASRNPTAAQWKALVVRDRHCQAPGRTQPSDRCHAHHIHHWTRGGPTDLDNLQLLCWHHHRQTHMHDAPARAASRERLGRYSRDNERVTCDMCESAERIERGDDPFAIARLSTGYVSLCATQHFHGYTFFFAKQCVREIYDLPAPTRTTHLHEMTEVAHALARAFNPRKLNYEALGNGTAHLHWHLIPRYDTDPHPRGPVWEDLSFLRKFWLGGAPPDETTAATRSAILRELRNADVTIEHEYVDA